MGAKNFIFGQKVFEKKRFFDNFVTAKIFSGAIALLFSLSATVGR